MFCKLFSDNSTGRWVVLQLPCCPNKQGELSENILQNLRNKFRPRLYSILGANLHADVVDEGVQIAVREPPEGLHAVGALGVTLVLEPHHIWSIRSFLGKIS